MSCAYCGGNKTKTREHIISSSVLELFPECDYTYDDVRGTVYKSDPVINDVCIDCNNKKLSYIDSYAKSFISNYFLVNYNMNDTLKISYDYTMLLKVLLKYMFNDLRAHRGDISFFDNDVIQFLLDENRTTLDKNITILSGLSVNTSVMPDFFIGNKKLIWVNNPIFLENSIIEHFDDFTGQVYRRDPLEQFKMDDLLSSYLFKFNSGLFVILCWKSDSKKYLEYEQILDKIYPYTLIDKNKSTAEIKRCTHAYNWFMPQLIDVNWGLDLADITNSMMNPKINPLSIQDKLNKPWKEYENKIKAQHINKKSKKKKKKK